MKKKVGRKASNLLEEDSRITKKNFIIKILYKNIPFVNLKKHKCGLHHIVTKFPFF